MQILHPFAGSVQQYTAQLADPDCYRPGHCPQCHTKHPLTASGTSFAARRQALMAGALRIESWTL